jgi:succinylarginine dihydrolase
VVTTREWNFDGLVGPTHTFAGLATGNLASAGSAGTGASPRAAARQGLAKMRRMVDLGVPQGVLPPHPRPDVRFLRAVGFDGDDASVIAAAATAAPDLFLAATSASSMWVANAATVAPSSDTADGRLHLTPANLTSQLHRSLEAPTTTRILRAVFGAPGCAVVDEPLPAQDTLGDEGAANHTRFGPPGEPGAHLFVFGRVAGAPESGDRRFRGRQTETASRAVARRSGLADEALVYAQQRPATIDAGVFHNDVIAVGHDDLLLCHELAFVDQTDVIDRVRRIRPDLRVAQIPAAEVDLDAAVRSYLFNSQLVTTGDGLTVLVAPSEVRADPAVADAVDALVADGFLGSVEIVDLTESMGNGGGPACLRLRVELNEAEASAVPAGCRLDAAAIDGLEAWVDRHYRDELAVADLADPQLLDESRRALDELTGLLGVGAIYEFQR